MSHSPRGLSTASRGWRLAVAGLLTLLLGPLARADQPDETLPFFRPDGVFDVHGIDNVNLFSGDTGIVIPLGPEYLLGPTTRWQLKAFNTVKLWHYSQSCTNDPTARFAYVSGDPTLGVGWTLRPGYVEKVTSPVTDSHWFYWAPDGSPHVMDLVGSASFVTADGSHLRIKAIPNASSPTSYTVEFPDGSVQTFDQQFSPPGGPYDFRTWDYGATAPTRFGLRRVDDKFGNKVLEVAYDASNPAEFTSIKLAGQAFGGSAPTITFSWTSFAVGGSSWRVLDYVLFPAPGGTQLKVKFTFQAPLGGVGFKRNNFDLPSSSCVNPPSSPSTTPVPELTRIEVSDHPTANSTLWTTSYFFDYYQAETAGGLQEQGTLKTITLPSRQAASSPSIAYITYEHATTGNFRQITDTCEPYTCPGTTAPEPSPPGNINSYTTFLDKTPAVNKRTEFDPFTNRMVVTTYDRQSFFVYDLVTGGADPDTFVRRVTVKRPGNDDGTGKVQYSTQHFFHAAFAADGHEQDASNGIELERRDFDDSDPFTATIVRDAITCYGGCGFKDNTGTVYPMTLADRIPPTAEVTWFAARPSPTSSDGGTCSGTTPPCTAVTNTNYNTVAGHYDDTNTKSTLPGPGGVNIDRTVETNWTASSATQTDWLLDLYDHRFAWDGGASPPVGLSDGETAVRQYANFDSANGFLKASWTWDSIADKVIMNCRYNGGLGIVSGAFSQTYPSSAEPTASNCPTGIPSISADSDAFGKDHTWTNLLLTRSNWRSGSLSIGWNSFDTTRDTNTGLILTSKDPNSALTTTYSYDRLGRLTQIQPPGGSSVEWPTTICYLPSVIGSGSVSFTPFILVKKVTASPTLGPSGTACVADDGTPSSSSGTFEGYQYDGLGRLIREIRRVNHALSTTSYFSMRESRYDSAGHRAFLSDWQPCALNGYGATDISGCSKPQVVNPLSAPGPSTAWSNFDPLDRAQEIKGKNGTSVSSDVLIDRTDTSFSPTVKFSDSMEKVTTTCVNGTWSGSTCSGGVSSITVTVKDALGRLIKVTEPDPVTGNSSSDVTSYTYDVLDKVLQVTQGSQTRIFKYYAFGFLEKETTPENGVNGGADTKYDLYGSAGNLRTKSDGSGTQTQYNYTYDVAGRLTLLTTGMASPYTKYLVNCYDGTGACGDTGVANYAGGTYPKGRLTRRLGWNQMPFSATPVYDDFNYSASSGRVSSQITSIGQRGTDLTKNGFGTPVTQSWTYNNRGLMATHVHPRASGSATTLTVNDLEYTSGLLTKITASWQGSGSQQLVTANYHESGRLADYTTASPTTVKTTIAADSLMPSRPGRISSSVGGFDTGTFAYDGAGNIKQMSTSDTFRYDARSRLTSAKYTGLSGSCPDGTFTMSQCFAYDRYGNLLSKAGANAVTLTTSTSTNHLTSGSAAYDARGNMTVFSSEGMQYDLLNRNYKVTDSTPPGTDFMYLYDGAGERVGKFPSGGGALRRELARVIIEARGDTSLACTPNPFTDVVCSSNPNDGKYVQKLKDIGISAGCGGGAYCPDTQIPREQAAVFFLLGKQCTVNVNNCTWTPPACTPPPNQRFADVPCPSTYADWIEELADEGITAGCPGGNFCPTLTLGSFQMLAWASVIWPTYAPLPRNTILTFRDEKGRVASESHQKSSSGDDTEVAIYERDNAFLGGLMISSVVWSGTNWTTPGWQFYSSDHLGSARLTTNTSAATVETKKYWPYGDEAATTGNAAQRLKFASMERDDEANHFYDHARHHDFNIGRFVSPEPVWSGAPAAPQTWNRYTYALGSPSSVVDPDGKIPIGAVVVLAGGLYGAADAALEYYGEHGDFSASAAGKGFAKGALATGATLLFKNPVVGGAVVGGLFEAGEEFASGGQVSPVRVAVAAGIGAAAGGAVRLLGPRPGTFEARLWRWRGIGEYFAGRNVTRQTASGLFSGAYEAANGGYARSILNQLSLPEFGVLGPGAFWFDVMSRVASENIPGGTVSVETCTSPSPFGTPGNPCPR